MNGFRKSLSFLSPEKSSLQEISLYTPAFKVEVLGDEHDADPDFQFQLQISNGVQSFKVLRNYEEFSAFHSKLKSTLKKVELPSFPKPYPKKLSESDVEKMGMELNTYISSLIQNRDVMSCQAWFSFVYSNVDEFELGLKAILEKESLVTRIQRKNEAFEAKLERLQTLENVLENLLSENAELKKWKREHMTEEELRLEPEEPPPRRRSSVLPPSTAPRTSRPQSRRVSFNTPGVLSSSSSSSPKTTTTTPPTTKTFAFGTSDLSSAGKTIGTLSATPRQTPLYTSTPRASLSTSPSFPSDVGLADLQLSDVAQILNGEVPASTLAKLATPRASRQLSPILASSSPSTLTNTTTNTTPPAGTISPPGSIQSFSQATPSTPLADTSLASSITFSPPPTTTHLDAPSPSFTASPVSLLSGGTPVPVGTPSLVKENSGMGATPTPGAAGDESFFSTSGGESVVGAVYTQAQELWTKTESEKEGDE